MIVLLDFDGTCVEHAFPEVGNDIGAIPILKKLVNAGHQLILFTVRSDKEEIEMSDDRDEGLYNAGKGAYLQDAINWFKKNDIPLYGVQENPTQSTWSTSPKPYAHIIVDDTSLGVPLMLGTNGKPCVNWIEIDKYFKFSKWYE